MQKEIIKIITMGGTIDKIYFDQLSQYHVGKPQVSYILKRIGVTCPYEVESLFKKDSLEITEEDRQCLYDHIVSDRVHSLFLVTHGTDTMVETARFLASIPNKVIVLTGALSPALFQNTDAIFNIGFALGALQALSAGTYIAMNGRIFLSDAVVKNRSQNRFEEC